MSYFFFLGLRRALTFELCLILFGEEGMLVVWVGIAYFLFGGSVWLIDYAIIFLAMWAILFFFFAFGICILPRFCFFNCLFIASVACSTLMCYLGLW